MRIGYDKSIFGFGLWYTAPDALCDTHLVAGVVGPFVFKIREWRDEAPVEAQDLSFR